MAPLLALRVLPCIAQQHIAQECIAQECIVQEVEVPTEIPEVLQDLHLHCTPRFPLKHVLYVEKVLVLWVSTLYLFLLEYQCLHHQPQCLYNQPQLHKPTLKLRQSQWKINGRKESLLAGAHLVVFTLQATGKYEFRSHFLVIVICFCGLIVFFLLPLEKMDLYVQWRKLNYFLMIRNRLNV